MRNRVSKHNKIEVSGVFGYYDDIVSDPDTNEIIYMSFLYPRSHDKELRVNIKRKFSSYDKEVSKMRVSPKTGFDVFKSQYSKSSFAHILAVAKSSVNEIVNANNEATGDSEILDYLFVQDEEELSDVLMQSLEKNAAIPIDRSWKTFLSTRLIGRRKLKELNQKTIYDKFLFKKAYKLNITKEYLQGIITEGFIDGSIKMPGDAKTTNSDFINEVTGLDDYLNLFGDTLANRIQDSFNPKFNPDTDEYSDELKRYDDYCFYNGVNLYPAQKNGIEAVNRHLDEHDTAMVVAEMGGGNVCI